jgi:preprotein translocase subunit SecB
MAKQTTKTNIVKQYASTTEQALALSERVQLEDVRLVSCSCRQEPEAVQGKKKVNIRYSTKNHTNQNTGYLLVFPEFHLEGFLATESDKPVIKINATFLLAYKVASFDGFTKQGLKRFADLNGVYNAWPYWREFVQETTARMGLPTLTIPVFRIVTPQEVEPTSGKQVSGQKKARYSQKGKS